MSSTEWLLLGLVVAVATGVVSFSAGRKGVGVAVSFGPTRGPTIDPRRAAASVIMSQALGEPTRVG